MKKKILIVEDEESIVNFIKNRLESDIYDVDIAYDGKSAKRKVAANSYDLVTLDIMLPYVDGFEICTDIRKKSKQTLIVMVSAMDTEAFKTRGYDCGIDDYIPKPFSARELAVKIKSLIKRREEMISREARQVANIILDNDGKRVMAAGFEVGLTPSEYLILSTLIMNSNKVFSRMELAQLIYDNYLGEIDDRGIDSHIYHMRKKIKQYDEKEIIKTVRGMGYKINEN